MFSVDWEALKNLNFNISPEPTYHHQGKALNQDEWDRLTGKGAYYVPSAPGGGGSPPPPAPPPPPPPVPPLPTFTRMTTPDKNIKPAPTDIVVFDESNVDIALIQDLLYEDIGAVELANISRTDLIDGQSVIYSPIKNLPTIRREFNPNNIIATSHSTDYFSRFGIDLFERQPYEPYFDDDGNLVIEIEDVQPGEEIQVQILSNGTINIIEEL